jgi:hypothetical protein
MNTVVKFGLLASCLVFAGTTLAPAQEHPGHSPSLAQVVALDECDPVTFNAVLGPDFCKNVALGYFTTLDELFSEAAAGTPDPNWDFEPDTLNIKEGTTLSIVDQGGEPHTFTEVAKFGGGFIEGLNGGEAMGSRMHRRLFGGWRGQDPTPPRQPCRDSGSIERRTSF